AHAHGVWVAPHHGDLNIVYGMNALDDAYAPEKVGFVKGYDAELNPTAVHTAAKANYTTVHSDNAAVLAVFFDNGYWEKNDKGRWQAVDKNQISRPADTSTSLKYNISVLKNYQGRLKPLAGLPVQIIPDSDPSALKQGETLAVTVYVDGKPAADVPVIADYIGNSAEKVQTDAQGRARLTVRNSALNVVAAMVNHPTPNDAYAHLQRSVATLSFKAAK
ncbi:MAG: DUF4198 domain-containing protein, partial [Neisseria sp.]|nr:DUF4198 domain-containing protein [Neisseria sp.]